MALTPMRKVIHEWLHHARKVPSLPLARTFDLSDVAATRRKLSPAPSWVAIFMRAYGLLARQRPELRRAYIPLPVPHLYEHPFSAAAVLVERDWQGESVVFGARIRSPELYSVSDIDDRLRQLKEAPVSKVKQFRRQIRLGKMPWPLRRFMTWQVLNLSGARRAKHLGTFAMSSLGKFGVEQFHPLCPLSSYLTFGPVDPAGRVEVKLIYDHRVTDGGCVARCLAELEDVLRADALAQLRPLRTAV
jgi:hypothetical protein